jgi:hypothetical protein
VQQWLELILTAVPKGSFGTGSFARPQVKAFGRGLPLYKFKVDVCGGQVATNYLGICQSQARLPLQAKQASLRSAAFDLLQFAFSFSFLCGFGKQFSSSNRKRESGGQIACTEFSRKINFLRRLIKVSFRD